MQDLTVKEQTCDPVNDTIYMNFHSNMKEADYKKEIQIMSKDRNGIFFEDKEIRFYIKGTFGEECLSKIELSSEVEFGLDNISDLKEKSFFTFMKNELEKKYGVLTLSSSMRENNLEYIEGPGSAIAAIKALALNKEIPNWILDFAYLGTDINIDSLGNINSLGCNVNSQGNSNVYPPITRADITNEIYKEIDRLNSAEYISYFNKDKSVELIYVTSHFIHQDNYFAKKINTSRSHVIIRYYAKRYWIELEEKNKNLNLKKNIENHKRDSLLKTNLDRL